MLGHLLVYSFRSLKQSFPTLPQRFEGKKKKKKNYLQVASITNFTEFNGAICTKIGLNYMSETFASVFPKTNSKVS